MGVFLPEEILEKQLYSKKYNLCYPITGSLNNSPMTQCDEKCNHVESCH